MYSPSSNYKVSISGVTAGYLLRNEHGQVAFRFDEGYWKLNNRPILGQKFEDDRLEIYRGRKQNLPAFFANIVPEGQMRSMILHSLDLPDSDDLALLSATGDDLPGAIKIEPTDEGIPFPVTVENNDEHSNHIDSISGVDPYKLRFSLAGVQMKFSVIRQDDKIMLPAHNHLGRWIAKIDSLRFPNLVENEFSMMEWARSAGFSVPQCEILDSNSLPPNLRSQSPENSKIFLIKRYDREGQRRIHQEDFAQVIGIMPMHKYGYVSYEMCAQLVKNICGPEEYKEFIKRLIFMVASGNIDAHLKNFSLLYPDGINAELTPMYDQVCAIAWPDSLDMRWALTFTKTRQLHVISEAHFVDLIKESGGESIIGAKFIRDTVATIAEAWIHSPAPNNFPQEHYRKLHAFWQKVPLLREFATHIKL